MGKLVETKIAVSNKVCKYEPLVFITSGSEDKVFSEHSFFLVRYGSKIIGTMVRLVDSKKRNRLYVFCFNRGSEFYTNLSINELTMGVLPMPAELAILNDSQQFVRVDEDEWLTFGGNGGKDTIEVLEDLGIDMEYWELADFVPSLHRKHNIVYLPKMTSTNLPIGKYNIMLDGIKQVGTIGITEKNTVVDITRRANLRLTIPKDFVPELYSYKIGLSELIPVKEDK